MEICETVRVDELVMEPGRQYFIDDKHVDGYRVREIIEFECEEPTLKARCYYLCLRFFCTHVWVNRWLYGKFLYWQAFGQPQYSVMLSDGLTNVFLDPDDIVYISFRKGESESL